MNDVKTVNLLSSVKDPPTTSLLITFKANSPADTTMQTFETNILFASLPRTSKMVILFVRIKGQHDSQALEYLPCEPIPDLSDSEEDYDIVSRLNPAFLKKKSSRARQLTREKSYRWSYLPS